MQHLIEIMKQLRDPKTGCPWDIQQNFASIVPYTLEEAYEVADAIARNDLQDLKEELGDLLLQVIFHSQMASEIGAFTIEDVVQGICDKMIRRHPHVFTDTAGKRMAAGDVKAQWESIKASEKPQGYSALDSVTVRAPALTHAYKLQKAAAKTGFDWDAPEPILEKLSEETAEFIAAAADKNRAEMLDEYGDLLFTLVNIGRAYKLDPETALANANTKFATRFRAMEALAAERGQDFAELSLDAQEALWVEVKEAHNPLSSPLWGGSIGWCNKADPTHKG